jgi:hypothetical protein
MCTYCSWTIDMCLLNRQIKKGMANYTTAFDESILDDDDPILTTFAKPLPLL